MVRRGGARGCTGRRVSGQKPVVLTPSVTVFDFATGQSVTVSRLEGGNVALSNDRRRVLRAGVNLRPLGRDGGPLRVTEGLADAARRTLGDTTGLAPRYLEQLYAFGDADRSPLVRPSAELPGAARVVSIVYWALVGSGEAARATTGQNVRWFPADELPPLAFDHNVIVEYALNPAAFCSTSLTYRSMTSKPNISAPGVGKPFNVGRPFSPRRMSFGNGSRKKSPSSLPRGTRK